MSTRRDVTDLFSNPAAERCLLGCLIGRPVDEVRRVDVDLDDFRDTTHRAIYGAVQELAAGGSKADLVTLEAALRRRGHPVAASSLMDLYNEGMDSMPGPLVEILQKCTERRRGDWARTRLGSAVDDPTADMEAVVAEVVEGLPRGAPASLGRRSRLLNDEEVAQLREGRALVGDLLGVGELSVIYGPPESSKTFLALDLSLSIATGLDALGGRPVLPGPVVYVYAEGTEGLNARVAAWKQARGVTGAAGVEFLASEVNLLDPRDVDLLVADVRGKLAQPPVLFVIDPLAECFGGKDENAPADMGQAVRSLKRLRREFGAAVLVVHHPGRSGTHERGHTSLRGAADAMFQLTPRDGGVVLVQCTKRRNGTRFAPFTIRRREVGPSCIVERVDAAVSDALSPRAVEALGILRGSFGEMGATWAEWQKTTTSSSATFCRALAELQGGGFIENDGKGRGKRYMPTRGITLTHSQVALMGVSESAPCSLSSLSPPLRGDSESEGGDGPDRVIGLSVWKRGSESTQSETPSRQPGDDGPDPLIVAAVEVFGATVRRAA